MAQDLRWLRCFRRTPSRVAPEPVAEPVPPPAGDPAQAILAYWRRSGLPIRPGVASADVESFQRQHGVVLPADVLSFYRLADGSSTNDMDNALIRFWPLGEFKPVHEALNELHGSERWAYPGCFIFADYLIDSWLYAVRLTADPAQPAPVFRVLAGDPPRDAMAASFAELISRYAARPDRLV